MEERERLKREEKARIDAEEKWREEKFLAEIEQEKRRYEEEQARFKPKKPPSPVNFVVEPKRPRPKVQ